MAKFTKEEIREILKRVKRESAEIDTFLFNSRKLDRADAKKILAKAASIIKLVAPLFGGGVSIVLKGIVKIIGWVK